MQNVKGICDLCGFLYPVKTLKYEVVNRRKTGFRLCEMCFSPDHPQWLVGTKPIFDKQQVPDPRPIKNIEQARSVFSWNPVGNPLRTAASCKSGSVTVTIG